MPRIAYAAVLIFCFACAKKESSTETAASTQPTPETKKEMTLVYSEDFSGSGGWTQSSPGSAAETYYKDGEYVVGIDNSASPYGVASGLAPTEFDDVSVEVDAKQIAGERGSIGVICRASNAGYYFADINAATARIGIYAKEQEVLSETNAPAVWKADAPNRLRFDCIGDQLNLHVNGKHVLAGADSRLPIGKIGVLAGGTKEGKITASFDNLVVKKP